MIRTLIAWYKTGIKRCHNIIIAPESQTKISHVDQGVKIIYDKDTVVAGDILITTALFQFALTFTTSITAAASQQSLSGHCDKRMKMSSSHLLSKFVLNVKNENELFSSCHTKKSHESLEFSLKYTEVIFLLARWSMN